MCNYEIHEDKIINCPHCGRKTTILIPNSKDEVCYTYEQTCESCGRKIIVPIFPEFREKPIE